MIIIIFMQLHVSQSSQSAIFSLIFTLHFLSHTILFFFTGVLFGRTGFSFLIMLLSFILLSTLLLMYFSSCEWGKTRSVKVVLHKKKLGKKSW